MRQTLANRCHRVSESLLFPLQWFAHAILEVFSNPAEEIDWKAWQVLPYGLCDSASFSK